MPKYVCPECKKIVIRSAADMRITKGKSYCESSGKDVILTRLKVRTVS
jgi:hypothetical protein